MHNTIWMFKVMQRLWLTLCTMWHTVRQNDVPVWFSSFFKSFFFKYIPLCLKNLICYEVFYYSHYMNELEHFVISNVKTLHAVKYCLIHSLLIHIKWNNEFLLRMRVRICNKLKRVHSQQQTYQCTFSVFYTVKA